MWISGPGGSGRFPASSVGLALFSCSLSVLLFSSFAGCGPSKDGKAGGGKAQVPGLAAPKVCEIRVSAILPRVHESVWYRDARKKLASLRQRSQRILDGMTSQYKMRFALDIRAAKHIKKEEELERLRGSVISEAEYRSRWERLQALLDADPRLKKAVMEQRNQGMAYRMRKQQALMAATKIALMGRRLEKQLADAAHELDERLQDVLRASIRQAAAEALSAKRCGLVCAGAVVVGARTPLRGSCKMRAEVDLTEKVFEISMKALGGPAGAEKTAPPAARGGGGAR